MSPKDEKFDPVAARRSRAMLATMLEQTESKLAKIDDPNGLGDVTPIAKHDSPEFPLKRHVQQRSDVKESLQTTRNEMVKALELIDKKLAEYEEG